MTDVKLDNIFVIPTIDQPLHRVALEASIYLYQTWTAICQLQQVYRTSFERRLVLQLLCIRCSVPLSCWKKI